MESLFIEQKLSTWLRVHKVKETQLSKGPKNRLFIIEFVSINAFLQENQQLFVSLGVTTDSVTGVYPIIPTETMTSSDPAFAVRRFGSQRVPLYADANTGITITVARDNVTVPLKRLWRSQAGL